MKKKKILIVAESIDVEDSSGTKGRVALIKNLIRIGYDVQVYHYTRKKIGIEGATCVAIKEKKFNITYLTSRIERQFRNRLKIDLHGSLEKIFGFSFTLFNDRNSIIAALKKIDFQPDLVITLSKGGSFRPHHALLKLPEFHKRWMAYIHDPYPMHCYPRPYDWVEPGHQEKRKFILEVSKRAAYVAYPSKLLAEWMESYFSPLKGKAVIIPHQISEIEIREQELPDFFQKEKFTVLHAGNLLSARKPYGLIKAFQQFLNKNPEARKRSQLLFLGDNSKFKDYFEKLREELPQLYTSKGSLPFRTVLAAQRKASVNVILEAKGPVSPFLPGKFPHCIQAGNPVLLLGPYYSESRRLLGKDYPYWAEIDDVNKISGLLKILYMRWNEGGPDKINRSDLIDYSSSENLKNIINSI